MLILYNNIIYIFFVCETILHDGIGECEIQIP